MRVHELPAIWPMPRLIISTRDKNGVNNALALAFAMNCSIEPPMVMIGVHSSRYSNHMIKENPCFVVNYPLKSFEKEFVYLGTHSGRDGDKLAAMNIEIRDGDVVNAPILTACPVSVECKVVEITKPGSHDLFAATIEKMHCDPQYLDEHGRVLWENMDLLTDIMPEKYKR